MLGQVRRIAEAEKRADHRDFVEDMEHAERRRDRWSRLLGRTGRRLEPLTRDESINALGMMQAVLARHNDITDEAYARLRRSVRWIKDSMLSAGISDDTLGTIVSVRFRYLQHDLRTGMVDLPKPLRTQVLAARVTIDTWDD